jgi:hypothetical protein
VNNIFNTPKNIVYSAVCWTTKPKVKDAETKLIKVLPLIRLSFNEDDRLRMTDLYLSFLCTFGQIAQKVTYCSFKDSWKTSPW